jgi:hypothetical protein
MFGVPWKKHGLEGLVQLKRLDGCDMKGRLRNMSYMDQSVSRA